MKRFVLALSIAAVLIAPPALAGGKFKPAPAFAVPLSSVMQRPVMGFVPISKIQDTRPYNLTVKGRSYVIRYDSQQHPYLATVFYGMRPSEANHYYPINCAKPADDTEAEACRQIAAF